MGKGVGDRRRAHDIRARGIEAGTGRIESSERRAHVGEILATDLAAEREADGVPTPQRPDLAAGVEVDTAQPGHAIALEDAVGRLLDARRIAEGARVNERATSDGVAATEGIEGSGGVGQQRGGLREAGALDGLVFVGATLGVHHRTLPRPRSAELSAEAQQAAVSRVGDRVDPRTEVPKTVVHDVDRARRAGETRRAVGVGCTGGTPEAVTKGIVGIRRRNEQRTVHAALVDVRVAIDDRAGAVVIEIGEGGEARAQVVFATEENIFSGGLRLQRAGVVEVPIVFFAWSGGGAGWSRRRDTGLPAARGRHQKEAARRREERGGDARGPLVRNEERAILVATGAHDGVELAVGARGRALKERRVGVHVPRGGGAGDLIAVGGKGPVAQEGALAIIPVGREREPAFFVREIEAVRERGAILRTVAVFGGAKAQRQLGTAKTAVHYVIHYPRDGVGAVDRRGAVAQDVDPLDAAIRELVDVHGQGRNAVFIPTDRMGSDAPTVEQDEGVAGSESAERDIGVVAAGILGRERRLVTGQTRRHRQHGEQVRRLARIIDFELLGLDGGHGQRALGLDAFDVGTRDGDRLQFHGFVSDCGGGSGRGLREEGGGGNGQHREDGQRWQAGEGGHGSGG